MVQRSVSGSKGSQARARNLSITLLSLLDNDGISRVTIADRAGLSTAAISKITGELIDQGLVVEEGTVSTGSVGRPQRALYLVPDARYALAIHINVDYVRVALTDLLAHTVTSHTLPYGDQPPVDDVLNDTVRAVHDMLAEQNVATGDIVGVGIAASGLVDPSTGVNVLAPNLGWQDVALRDYFEQKLNLPVCVDNNVRAMALGEAMFGIARDVYSLAFVYSHIGVGAGLVVDGELYRGGAGGAGEIGHTTIMLFNGEPCRCGNHGCLETLVSDRVIIKLAKQLAGQNRIKSPILYEHMKRSEYSDMQNIFDAARSGDEPTGQLLRKRAEYMGIGLANLVNIVNPEMIVFGGTFAQGADILLPKVEAVIRERAFADLGGQVQVRATEFTDEGITGAAALALDTFFYRAGVREMA
ncbi:MAG: ROK family transcriptional regulator [Chloroflexi bacterium]|nr:ROK family transcriptional regulator [Chloroflexota bacterium]